MQSAAKTNSRRCVGTRALNMGARGVFGACLGAFFGVKTPLRRRPTYGRCAFISELSYPGIGPTDILLNDSGKQTMLQTPGPPPTSWVSHCYVRNGTFTVCNEFCYFIIYLSFR